MNLKESKVGAIIFKKCSFLRMSSMSHCIMTNLSLMYVNFYKNYTTKTTLYFSEEFLCVTWLKHVVIIEDYNNVILTATSARKVLLPKKWNVNNCKISNQIIVKLAKRLLKVSNLVELFSVDIWQMQLWTNIF